MPLMYQCGGIKIIILATFTLLSAPFKILSCSKDSNIGKNLQVHLSILLSLTFHLMEKIFICPYWKYSQTAIQMFFE